jgi:hypothetical protein
VRLLHEQLHPYGSCVTVGHNQGVKMKKLMLLAFSLMMGACAKYESNPYLAGNWKLDNANCGLSFTEITLTKDGHYKTNTNQSGEWSHDEGVINFNGNILLIGLGDYRNMVIRDNSKCNASFNKIQ